MKKMHLMLIALILLVFFSCDFGFQDSVVSRPFTFNVPGKKPYYFYTPEGEVPDSSNFPEDPVVDGFVFEGWRKNIENNNANNVFLSTEEYDLDTPMGSASVDLFAVLIPESWAKEGSVYRQLESGTREISIATAEDLNQLSEITNMHIDGSDTFSLNSVPQINSGFEGVTITIENDIDLSGVSFKPLSENDNFYLPRFSGTIQGKTDGVVTISNLSDSLIAVATGNVAVKNIKLSGNAKTAGFIKSVREGWSVVLENCISDVNVRAENDGEGYTDGFGGFIGEVYASSITLKDLQTTRSLDLDHELNSIVGGIAGILRADEFSILDLEIAESVSAGMYAGGFFGSIDASGDLTIANASLNTDTGDHVTINGSSAAGGIIGNVQAIDITLSSCSVGSSITITSAGGAGAFIGSGNCRSIFDSTSFNYTGDEKYGDRFYIEQTM